MIKKTYWALKPSLKQAVKFGSARCSIQPHTNGKRHSRHAMNIWVDAEIPISETFSITRLHDRYSCNVLMQIDVLSACYFLPSIKYITFMSLTTRIKQSVSSTLQKCAAFQFRHDRSFTSARQTYERICICVSV